MKTGPRKVSIMKKTIFTAMFAMVLSVNVSAAVIDFEGYADDTLITDQYASLGIIFDGAWIENDYESRGSRPNWISGEVDGVYNNINPGAVTGYFVNPLDSSLRATTDYLAGLTVYPDGGSPIYLEVFDLDDNLLASDMVLDDGVLSVAVAGIARFSFYHVAELDDVLGYDDITFNDVVPMDVPEPTSLLLLATGLIGLCFSNRRKHPTA